MAKLDRFLTELHRRRVLRVTLAYAAAAFAAVQAAEIYFPALGLPAWLFHVLVLLTLLGLPVAVTLAWIFDFSRTGVHRTQSLGEKAEAGASTRAGTEALVRAAAALALVVLLLGAAAFVAVRSGRLAGGGENAAPGPPSGRFTVSQLTAEPGIEWFPSISPDGEWLVYSGLSSTGRDIFLRSVGGEHAINLTPDSPGDDDHPVFSPDGQRIAFWSARGGGGIFVMSRTGEAVRRVTRAGYQPTWSPDGRSLAFVTENVELHPQNMDRPSQLWIVDFASGRMRVLEGVTDAVAPSWSPHGHRIAFFQRTSDEAGGWGIWTVDTAGRSPVRVTRGESRDWSPAWEPEGEHLYFASDRGGSMNLWRVAIDETTGAVRAAPEPIITPATSLAHISPARDGHRVLYTSVLVTINVQRLAVVPGTARPAAEPVWVTSGTRRWSSPDPAPDGERLAMYSLTQPEGNLYVINVDGTGLRQVTGDSAGDRVPRWSPDGEWIAFFSTREGDIQLWKMRADGSELQRLSAAGAAAAWAPDGSRIATVAVGGPPFLLDPLRSWQTQQQDTLRLEGVAQFSPNDWSHDGRWLAGTDGFGDTGIIIFDLATGRNVRLTDHGQWPVWLADSRTLLFVSGGTGFYTVDRDSRDVERVFAVERDVIGPPRFSSDHRYLYFTRRVTEADVWMVTLE